jgi:4-coumarate--CoA ligase
MRRFDLESFLSNVGKYSITEFGIVPPIVIAIIMSGLTSKYPLTGVKDVSIGAAPLGLASQDRFKQLLDPGVTVNQVWGMTETSCVASKFWHPEDDRTGSVGRMIPNLDAKYEYFLDPIPPTRANVNQDHRWGWKRYHRL